MLRQTGCVEKTLDFDFKILEKAVALDLKIDIFTNQEMEVLRNNMSILKFYYSQGESQGEFSSVLVSDVIQGVRYFKTY